MHLKHRCHYMGGGVDKKKKPSQWGDILISGTALNNDSPNSRKNLKKSKIF